MSDTRVCSQRQARRPRFSSGTSFGFAPSEQAPHDQRQYRRWDRPLEHQPGVDEAGAGEDGLWTGRSRHRPRYRVHLRRGETIHTAVDDPQCTDDATPRESVECRVFCFIPPPDGFGLVAKAKLGLAMAKSRLIGRARL